MSFINRIVDKVYVINLDKEKERLKVVDESLRKHSIEYTRFPAIDGSKITTSKYLSSNCNKFCTDGTKGCALSHRGIWEDMIQKHYSSVLVLEDDVKFDENFNEKFKQSWDSVPKDYDIIWVGCNFICDDPMPVPQILSSILQKSTDINSEILQVQGSIGTHAYIISRKAAQHFLGKSIHWHIDTVMNSWITTDNLKSYFMKLHPIKNNEEQSVSSNISDKFPPLLNTLLSKVKVSQTNDVAWSLGENVLKLGPYNINYLLIIFILVIFITPFKYIFLYVIWISFEFLVSHDTLNSSKYLLTTLFVYGLRYGVFRLLYPRTRQKFSRLQVENER